jgi:hypothetical protein
LQAKCCTLKDGRWRLGIARNIPLDVAAFERQPFPGTKHHLLDKPLSSRSQLTATAISQNAPRLCSVTFLARRLSSLLPMPSLRQQTPVELLDFSKMDRVRRLFNPRQNYQPIERAQDDESGSEPASEEAFEPTENPFSQVEYWIFLLLGVAMLWAWLVLESNEPEQS